MINTGTDKWWDPWGVTNQPGVKPTGVSMSSGAGQGVDPNLLRLLAERQRKQGLVGNKPVAPTQRPPAPAPGTQPQTAPMSPRLRAALMLQQRRRQQMQQQQAPGYGQAPSHGQAVPRRV